MSETPTGKLVFNFVLDPGVYKQEMQKIQRQINEAEAQGTPIKDTSKMVPAQKELITAKTMQKTAASQSEFEHTIKVLITNYENENHASNEAVIKDVSQKNSIWTRQAQEMLHVFKDTTTFNKAATLLIPRIKDKHIRFALVRNFSSMSQSFLSDLKINLGPAFNFCFWNPTGHYKLNLGQEAHREVAKCCLVKNRSAFDAVCRGELPDTSKEGNKSCFRNERIDGGKFVWSPEWVLPKTGTFEFDFIYLLGNRTNPQDEMTQQELSTLVSWFSNTVLEIETVEPN